MLLLKEIVKGLITELERRGVSIPEPQEPLWHKLFYVLYCEKGTIPRSVRTLSFEWEGAYPLSYAVAREVHSACVMGCQPNTYEYHNSDTVYLQHAADVAQMIFKRQRI